MGSGGINALEDLDCQIAALGYIGCSSFILSLHTWVRSTIWKKCWVSSVSLLRLNALCDICPFFVLGLRFEPAQQMDFCILCMQKDIALTCSSTFN